MYGRPLYLTWYVVKYMMNRIVNGRKYRRSSHSVENKHKVNFKSTLYEYTILIYYSASHSARVVFANLLYKTKPNYREDHTMGICTM